MGRAWPFRDSERHVRDVVSVNRGISTSDMLAARDARGDSVSLGNKPQLRTFPVEIGRSQLPALPLALILLSEEK